MKISRFYTIIPQQDRGLIVELAGDRIDVLAEIEIPYNSISKIIDDEIVVTLDKDNKQLLLHNMEGNLIKSIPVPYGIAMNVKEHIVYIGGSAENGEVCYLLDLDSKDYALQNIHLPVDMAWGKAVDGILILDDKMLLIDNIAFPKYTFEYDVSIPTAPRWLKTVDLPERRAYENIIKGDMNRDWMVYLSTSSDGWDGDMAHIGIEGKYENTISSSKEESIRDICLIDDRLYVMTDIGLGYFDLDKANMRNGDIVFVEHRIVADRIVKINDTKLLLVSRYEYELIDLDTVQKLDCTISERFWSYASLDLSGKGLTTLPDEIKNLKNLQYLDLSDNEFESLPEELKQCKKLRYLNLRNSGITEIPKWIAEFDAMEHLDLSGIDIGFSRLLKFKRIRFPENLRVLKLRYCQLLRIPPDVFKLKKLEHLNIEENMILWLPRKIGKLRNLKTLEGDWPYLYVSRKIAKLKKMTALELKSSFRGKMPGFVYSMTQLKRVVARNAGIESISSNIKRLVNLEYLDLRENKNLSELPEGIGKLKSLKTLGLSACSLKKLPESFSRLNNLEVLHLQHNKLEVLPEDIGSLKHLRKLNIEENKLQILPKSIVKLDNLRYIKLRENPNLKLTEEQAEWLDRLEGNGAAVWINDDIDA